MGMGLLDFSPEEWPGLLGSSAGRLPPQGPIAPLLVPPQGPTAPPFAPPTEAAYGEPTLAESPNTTASQLGKALGGMMDEFAARLAAARTRAMAPEAADHGLSERQKLSPWQRVLNPITSYPETYFRMNQDPRNQISHGWDQLHSPETYPWDTPATGSEFDAVAPHGLSNTAKGLGNMALGSVGYVNAPIGAAYRTLLGQPLEDLTGIPREWTEFAAQLATPGIGLARAAGTAAVIPRRPLPNGPSGIASTVAPITEELPARLPGAVGPAAEAAVATGSNGVVPAAATEASALNGPNASPGFAASKDPVTQELSGKHPQLVNPTTEAASSTSDGSGILPAARTEPSALNGPMPQFRERYAKTAPALFTQDEKTGKWYWAKQYTQEELQLEALLDSIQKDIDAGKITPYFDPAKRFYPDQTYYPRSMDTGDIKAVRANTQAKHEAIARSPEATQRLDDAFQRGEQQNEGARDFSALGQIEERFINEYGPKEGRRLFKEKFAEGIAATSAGADPRANLRMAQFARYMWTKGLQLPTIGADYPYPVGSQFVAPNMKQFQKLLMESSGITSANPKRYDYAGELLGHTDGGPPIDEQRFRLMDPERSAPPPGTYGHYKGAVVDRAAAKGVSPTYYGDMLYAGARKDHWTKPLISYINEMIERTHRVTGMARDEIVRRGLIRGEIPLFGLGGFLAGKLAGKQLSTDDDGS